jgi:hypothetical protein
MTTVTELGPRLGVRPLCDALGVAPATYYRRRRAVVLGPWPRRPARRALALAERQQVLDVLHAPRFADLAPAQVYATLLDEGTYYASERTMYRLLAAEDEVRERRAQAPSRLCGPRAARDSSEPGVELGYHQAQGADNLELVSPLCPARHL